MSNHSLEKLLTIYLNRKHSSLISVDHHRISSNSNDTIKSNSSSDRLIFNNIHKKQLSSLTQMLFIYAQQEIDIENISIETNLMNILNVLELYFNMYADDKQEIYFEGIFRILLDFKEQITESALIETMNLLQINPFHSCNFENFILILCHLPPIKSDHHTFLDIFNELDHNKDSYITFEDIQIVLPHFDEEILRAVIHIIDTDHDNGRLSYMDFVTSFIALQECKSTMKIKTIVDEDLHRTTK